MTPTKAGIYWFRNVHGNGWLPANKDHFEPVRVFQIGKEGAPDGEFYFEVFGHENAFLVSNYGEECWSGELVYQ